MKSFFGMGKNYHLLLSAYFISNIGDWLYNLALPLLVYEITKSPLSVAFAYALTYLPFIIFLPIGGIFADRFDRRMLLLIGDAASAVIAFLLACLVYFGLNSLWLIYPMIFFLAGVTPLYHPAFQSMMPTVIKREQYAQGNAWISNTENIVTLIGPIVGGGLIAILSSTGALFLDAFSFAVSALLIYFIRTHTSGEIRERAETSISNDIKEGFRFVATNPILFYGSILFLGINLSMSMFQGNYVYFLTEIKHFNYQQLGIAFAVPGLGALVGANVAPHLLERFRPGKTLLACTILSGIMMIPILVSDNILLIILPWSIVTALSSISAVTWFTLRQQIVPEKLLGRVIAFTRLVAFSAIPLGAIIGGAILSRTENMGHVIMSSMIVGITVGVLGLFTPLNKADGENLEANLSTD